MENTYVVATLNIDRCPPIIELIDIKTSNTSNPNYITKKHSVSGHFRVNEKNIFSNSVSVKNFTIFVNETQIKTAFTTLTLSSETPDGPIYEFYLKLWNIIHGEWDEEKTDELMEFIRSKR